MKNIQVTEEIKMEVIKYFGYMNDSELKSAYLNDVKDDLFQFYYYCMQSDIDVCDADRYANLNTMVGYDVGLENFRAIDNYLWCEKDYDLLELSANDSCKQIIKNVIEVLNLDIDLSKWRMEEPKSYIYYTYAE